MTIMNGIPNSNPYLNGNGINKMNSIFDNVQSAPPDAILGLNADFRADPSPNKVNLGVGAYRTEENLPLVLPVVKKVEHEILSDPSTNHEYLPQDGLSTFCTLSSKLLLGEDSVALQHNRSVTVQSLSGTGALRLCFEFLRANGFADAQVYVPSPTWPNHQKLVVASGLKPAKSYTYYDEESGGVNFTGMCSWLNAMDERSVVILHACAHNPTGADLTEDQWRTILDIVQVRKIIPLFDCAYQGFASGDLEKDAFAIRLFANSEMPIDMFVGQSYAKNMGLYGERIGTLTVISNNAKALPNVKNQLKSIARTLYSSPPVYGARIVSAILSNNDYFEEWKVDLKKMANRILRMRKLLKQALIDNKTPGNWDHITSQIGMFSFTKLSKEQVVYMREKYAIYMTLNGRMSMAGLTEDTIQYVADAMREAVLTRPKNESA